MNKPIPDKYYKDIYNAIMETAINGWNICQSDAEATAIEILQEIDHIYLPNPFPYNPIPKCHLKTLCHAICNVSESSEVIGTIQDILDTLQGTFFNDEEIGVLLKDNELYIKHLSEEKEQEAEDDEGHPLSGCIKEIDGHKYRLEPVE